MGADRRDLPVAAIAALQEGNKIQAIKLVREATGLGLKESNDLVSAYIASRPELAERFGAMAERGRRGCLLVIAIAAAVVAALVTAKFYRG